MIEPSYTREQAHGLWVYLEQDGGELLPVSLEILARARQLAAGAGVPVAGLLLGDVGRPLIDRAARLGVDQLYVASHRALRHFTAEAYAHVVAEAVLAHRPDILLLGATPYGRDLAGRLAVRLRTGLTADCTGLELDREAGILLGEVSGFGGGILATIKCEVHRPQMATVRPGVFAADATPAAKAAPVTQLAVAIPPPARAVRVLAHRRRSAVDITRAERLVVAGAGTRGDVALVESLARALDAEVGATRVAVDRGWLERDRQVGQTGVVVAPKLAVVCGASGASQFSVGIEQAGLVVAVNQDPEAPIFEQADLCVVDDLFPVVRALVGQIESRGGGDA